MIIRQNHSPLFIFILLLQLSFSACAQKQNGDHEQGDYPVQKSQEEWKSELSELEYEVLREAGTEKAFSGKYVDWKKEGVFICKACNNPLFSSKTKFKSGTGWPSFYDYLDDSSIQEDPDNRYGMKRTEVVCQRCGSHLGHVFEDGPEPTGLRYCINSVALDFESKEE